MKPSGGFDFSDQSILVVGASRGGIGSAIAAAFQASGGVVSITGAEEKPVEADQERYPYFQLDVTDPDEVAALSQQIEGLNVLVNCAAISLRGEEMDPDVFERVVQINLHGTFRMATALLPQLSSCGGSIVNIASMYSTFGSPKNPAYGASKAGVEQLTKSLAIAWAEHEIRVNAVAPGFIVTEQSARSRKDAKHVANVEARTPMKRWGLPQDIAGPVLFLASPAAAFITGTCLAVDGGYSVV